MNSMNPTYLKVQVYHRGEIVEVSRKVPSDKRVDDYRQQQPVKFDGRWFMVADMRYEEEIDGRGRWHNVLTLDVEEIDRPV